MPGATVLLVVLSAWLLTAPVAYSASATAPALASVPALAPPASPSPEAWGYYPWWMRDTWRTLDLRPYQRLLFFAQDLQPDGTLSKADEWDADWSAFKDNCNHLSIPCDMVFLMSGKRDFEQLFGDPLLRQLALGNIVDTADRAHADGIQLDIEVFDTASAASVDGFHEFMQALRQRLDTLPAARRPLLSAFMTANGPLLFDRASAATLDRLVMQGYDAHWATGPTAGPVAVLTGPPGDPAPSWPQLAAAALATGLPRSHILLAAPYFGYEWPTASELPYAATTGAGEEATYTAVNPRAVPRIQLSASARAAQYGARRDAISGSPYYAYQAAPGQWRQGWFEDGTSLDAKYRFLVDQRLGGVAIFAVGYDNGALDPRLTRYFGPRASYRASGAAPPAPSAGTVPSAGAPSPASPAQPN